MIIMYLSDFQSGCKDSTILKIAQYDIDNLFDFKP